MRRLYCVGVLILLMAGPLAAQSLRNPGSVSFTPSPDHALVTSYIIGFFVPGGSNPVQEIDLGKGTPDATNTITRAINTQPLAFGTAYVARVRAVAGSVSSDWSDASNPFDRVPGKPGGPTVK